jgi:hypothetical protein
MTWNPIDEPRDWVKLGGLRTPGLCEITGAGSPRRWDERESYGYSGATVVFHGLKLAHFALRLRFFTSQDWEDWYAFKPSIDKPPLGAKQGPLDIEHPLLAQVGITSAVVEDVMSPTQTADGEWTVELRMIEYRTLKFALAKPDASAATPVDPALQSAREKAANRIKDKRALADHLATDPQP